MAHDSSRLADFLPYLMSVTTNAVSDMIAGEYRARFGLKIPEWRVMAVLGDAGVQTQRQVAAYQYVICLARLLALSGQQGDFSHYQPQDKIEVAA